MLVTRTRVEALAIQVSPRLPAILAVGSVLRASRAAHDLPPSTSPESRMSQRKPRPSEQARQSQASRTPASRSGGTRGPASAGRSRRRTWLRRGLWTVLALAVLGLVGVGVAYAM